jgi:hypothetical protein
MLDILDLVEEVEPGGNGEDVGFIVSISPSNMVDGNCCALAVSGLLLRPKDDACRAVA